MYTQKALSHHHFTHYIYIYIKYICLYANNWKQQKCPSVWNINKYITQYIIFIFLIIPMSRENTNPHVIKQNISKQFGLKCVCSPCIRLIIFYLMALQWIWTHNLLCKLKIWASTVSILNYILFFDRTVLPIIEHWQLLKEGQMRCWKLVSITLSYK